MIVRLNGGMGNQIFQWAFGRSVSLARNEELLFHTVGLDNGQHRAYSLDAFNINVEFKNHLNGPIYGEPNFRYDSGVYTAPPNSYYAGCWQTEKYLNVPVIRKELQFRYLPSSKTWHIAQQILNINSCFVHVRRTDYLMASTAAYHGNMDMRYYDTAMTLLRSQVPDVKFFVFSDEPEWCRNNFRGSDVQIVSHNSYGNGTTGPGTEWEDLMLMANCKHAIIANSSFSWWGCWLGDTKQRIVIAPKVWFKKEGLEYCDIVPDRWLTI